MYLDLSSNVNSLVYSKIFVHHILHVMRLFILELLTLVILLNQFMIVYSKN
ncbi:hypothetical protein SDC9_156291 [bioreactor metagenome]|uniref:Uncharacterized protein n=1 Tax=bioreactor metagenome TaxID=1076179 RepID=A0A645F960_9ZZZZ